ncbi:translocation/assembly module TamB domain-containing protein [Snuella sedimenti]|uniref:Adhesin domain-containing protein n=1 Tax=Snuella sedimenti TaxID=2798802 RepID=A0A8J7IJB3_9FLAO|nr:hypothetical protein [Snuella sedimenti]MBJ6369241.1 hypothetical protein [Snuella sedimenti]
MKMFTYYKELITVTFVLTSLMTFSQELVTNSIEKTFKMTNSGVLHLDNKYGTITINGWDENRIAISIDIKVSNRKKDNALNLLDRIQPNIKASRDFISVTSEISERNTGFLSKYFNKVNPFEIDKGNVEINYTVYLPKQAEINLTNKFGDVIIDSWKGKLKVNLQHGDLWINETITNAIVDMKFGKLKCNSIIYGNINLKNGEMYVNTSKDLTLKTAGSIIKIAKVTSLELQSSKDDVVLEHIGCLYGELQFSNVQIDSVDREINLSMKVTELRVLNIKDQDAQVDINQESSNISVNISGLSFQFNAQLEEGLLRLPKSFANIETNILDKSKRIRHVKAIYGKSGTTGIFTINGKKGIITLKE